MSPPQPELSSNQEPNPVSRRDDVLCREVGGETVLYDPEHHGAHCLNPAAALVWRHADGSRSVAELARLLAERLALPEDEGLARLALAELARANLLEESAPWRAQPQVDRRQLLGRLGRVATLAALVPAVSSVLVPTAAASTTCLDMGEMCVSGVECCSGICFGGLCAG